MTKEPAQTLGGPQIGWYTLPALLSPTQVSGTLGGLMGSAAVGLPNPNDRQHHQGDLGGDSGTGQ